MTIHIYELDKKTGQCTDAFRAVDGNPEHSLYEYLQRKGFDPEVPGHHNDKSFVLGNSHDSTNPATQPHAARQDGMLASAVNTRYVWFVIDSDKISSPEFG